MTCREKLKLEHPCEIDPEQLGGCNGCPSDYGYLPDPEDCDEAGWNCTRCWDREIPETEVKQKPIKFKIFFGTMSLQLNKGMTADEKANEWIAANPGIDILQMQYHHTESGEHSICIMYKE